MQYSVALLTHYCESNLLLSVISLLTFKGTRLCAIGYYLIMFGVQINPFVICLQLVSTNTMLNILVVRMWSVRIYGIFT